jgi:hypothetical protein
MRITILSLIICLSSLVSLQGQNCPRYDDAMDEGNNLIAKKEYGAAILEFLTAQVAARECKLQTDAPTKALKKATKGLEQQKIDAEKAAVEAKRQAAISKNRPTTR